ncbi:MAG: type II secretion system protein N, partial [Candidatus Sericytochromatia bacterium]
AIDTDGTVRLTAYLGADGQLRVRAAATGAKPVAAPVAAKPAAKPAVQAPKPAAVAAAPNAPKATPTPMAVPAAKKPLAKPNQPAAAPKAGAFPESATNMGDGPHLQRSLSSSYAFPIERERVTGRSNPFKVLPNRAKPKPVTDVPGRVPTPPQAIGQVPSLPTPGMGAANTPPAVPRVPAASAKSYTVTAVVMGGGQPPVAAIKVDGKTHLVGLNDTLPGNARVKSIHADHVVLTSFNQDIRVGLKK